MYALGAILFELLTLDPLHADADLEELLDATRFGRVETRISVRRPDLDLPPELERACVLATQTSPDERLSITALHALVAGYLDGDRDLALRRELAQRHADAAARVHAVVCQGPDSDGKLRAEALQQAGHALALDPQSRTAIDVITHLMARPPRTIPPEAAAMLRREERASDRGALRWSAWVFLAFVPLLLGGFSAVRVNNWPAVAAMTVPLLLAIGLIGLGMLDRRLRTPPWLWLSAVLVNISAISCLGSPYLFMPALLTALGTGVIGTTRSAIQRPLLWSGGCRRTSPVDRRRTDACTVSEGRSRPVAASGGVAVAGRRSGAMHVHEITGRAVRRAACCCALVDVRARLQRRPPRRLRPVPSGAAAAAARARVTARVRAARTDRAQVRGAPSLGGALAARVRPSNALRLAPSR